MVDCTTEQDRKIKSLEAQVRTLQVELSNVLKRLNEHNRRLILMGSNKDIKL